MSAPTQNTGPAPAVVFTAARVIGFRALTPVSLDGAAPLLASAKFADGLEGAAEVGPQAVDLIVETPTGERIALRFENSTIAHRAQKSLLRGWELVAALLTRSQKRGPAPAGTLAARPGASSSGANMPAPRSSTRAGSRDSALGGGSGADQAADETSQNGGQP